MDFCSLFSFCVRDYCVCFVALCVINIKPFALLKVLKAKFFSNNNSNNKNYYLSERPEIAYSLRTRNHNKFLIPKTSDLGDRHFIVRSLYKNLYWCDFQIKLMCRYLRYLSHHSIFIVCIGVWTLYTVAFDNCFLKNKRWDDDDDDDTTTMTTTTTTTTIFFLFSLHSAVVSALHALLHSFPDCCKLHRIHCICILDCSYLNVRVNKISEINRQINK